MICHLLFFILCLSVVDSPLRAQGSAIFKVFNAPANGPIVIIIDPKDNNYANIKQIGYHFKKMFQGQIMAIQMFKSIKAAQIEHQVVDDYIFLDDNSKKSKSRLALEKFYGENFLGTIIINSKTGCYEISYYPKGTYTKNQDDSPESQTITLQ